MIEITRKLEFDAGHRLLGHESKCTHLHGHRYAAEITVSADELDSISRVVDFSVIKQKVGGWIDENWDHNFLVHMDDPLLAATVITYDDMGKSSYSTAEIFGGKIPYIIPYHENPTAEVMAKLLYQKAEELLGSDNLKVIKVRLHETPNCWADYTEETKR